MTSALTEGVLLEGGRRLYRKQTTRRELLAAGRRLFGEQGLYESRIEDLARHAGIAKGTLYGYFADKDELIEAVVSAGLSELLGHVHREAQEAHTHPEVLARVASAHLAFFEENPDLMRIFHQVRGLLKFRRPGDSSLRRALMNYLASLGHVLALHAAPRSGSKRRCFAMATILFGTVSGIASMRASLAESDLVGDQSRAITRGVVALVSIFEGRAGLRRPRDMAPLRSARGSRAAKRPRARTIRVPSRRRTAEGGII
jgi:AcrR family transcriptional regulator